MGQAHHLVLSIQCAANPELMRRRHALTGTRLALFVGGASLVWSVAPTPLATPLQLLLERFFAIQYRLIPLLAALLQAGHCPETLR
jgi:hypothetical protein